VDFYPPLIMSYGKNSAPKSSVSEPMKRFLVSKKILKVHKPVIV